MWLINTTTLQLEYFTVPPERYAILSHAWEDEEVIFEEMRGSQNRIRSKKGFLKIQRCSVIARAEKFDHVWIDTCCIDKGSSAELSEAINSMFAWYSEASCCMIYLYDVPEASFENLQSSRMFEHSRWFRRGWTLQELLAPKFRKFYTSDWTFIGSLTDDRTRVYLPPPVYFPPPPMRGVHGDYETPNSIRSAVCRAGRLPESAISMVFDKHCVSERMSWASHREVTRPEDMAYSLMGIFDVNMPIIYGEGETKAFRRLQEEILKTSFDASVFVWKRPTYEGRRSSIPPAPPGSGYGSDIFASSPRDFADLPRVKIEPSPALAPSITTNFGLSVGVWLVQQNAQSDIVLAATRDQVKYDGTSKRLTHIAYFPCSTKDSYGDLCRIGVWVTSVGTTTILANGAACRVFRRMVPSGLLLTPVDDPDLAEASYTQIVIQNDKQHRLTIAARFD